MKTCSKCEVNKPLAEFRVNARNSGLRLDCKDCQRKQDREHYKNNREQILLKAKTYYIANTERLCGKAVKWRIENPEKVKAANAKYYADDPDVNRARARQWAKDNPTKTRFNRSARRAAEKQATPIFADKKKMIVIYANAVEISRKTGVPRHVDHIVPLQSKMVCGLHCEANLQVLTVAENQSKSNRHWPDMP
jgi:hypothetical protein